MIVVDKKNLFKKGEEKNYAIFVDILASVTMSPLESGAHIALLQNSVGHTLKGPKLSRTHIEESEMPRGKD